MTGWMLPLFVAGPLLAGAVLIMVGKQLRLAQGIVIAITAASAVGGMWLVVSVHGGKVIGHGVGAWPGGIAIPFVADMLTALMITVTSLLTLACCAFAIASGYARRRYFPALVLILTAGVNGALLTADLFNLFVFIEVMLLPSYALLVMSAPGQALLERIKGARLYVSVNLLASTVFLTGVAFLYGVTGTVNMAELAGAAQRDPAAAVAATVCLLALGMKAAVVPVHGWLARTYTSTSPAVTALFSGLHTKVAIYAIYRIYAVIFEGDQRYLWVGAVLFTVTMVVGVLGSAGEETTRAILTFSTVSQVGYILLGLALFGPLGLMAGIFYLLHHSVVKASLFLSTGAIEVRYGTGNLYRIHGMARREPWVAVAFFAAALSLVGLPPFSGFVAKFALTMASIDAGQIAVAVVVIAVSLGSLLAMLKIWNEVFWGKTTPREDHPTGGAEPASPGRGFRPPLMSAKPRIGPALLAPAMALALLTLGIGLGGEFLLGLSEQAAAGLIDTGDYVAAVMDG